MVSLFRTDQNQLSEEEKSFKGLEYDYTKKLNPEESYQNLQENVIIPFKNELVKSGNQVQYDNKIRMTGVDVPSFNEISTMSVEELNNAKANILQKKNNATSQSFSTGYEIALQ